MAVEVYRDELSHRRRNWSIVAVAVSCSLLGAAIVLGAVRLAPHWFNPPQPSVVEQGHEPKAPAPVVAQQLYKEPVDPKVVETPNTQVKPPEPATGRKTPDPVPDTVPLNPFSGAIISRTPVPEGWTPGSESTAPASREPGASPPPPPTKTAESTLVTIRRNTSDPEGEAADVASALRASGASVRTATHYNAAGSPIGVQIIATLPAGSLNSALSRVGSGDRWTGDPNDRAREVSSIFSSRLRELRTREVELREKYEDDATEVAVVREEIQKLSQGLAMARAAKSPSLAVILVGIGDL